MCGKTVLLPMIDLNLWPGYHPWMPAYDIATSKSAVSTMSGNGLWGQRNLEDGADLVGKVGAMREFCSAMETQGSARHLFGNKDYSPERSESVLTSRGDSSLVVDWLCEWTRGQHTVVACFYSDFAARKEQTVTCMLGSLINQMINRTEGTSAKIWRALREQKDAVGGRRPQLSDIVKMLQLITSSQPTFMVIDALDECTAAQRYRLLDSLKEILEKSPDARIFVTGRPHVRAEIETRLAGRVTSVSISPIRSDIIRFLRARLGEDETPDAMDESLEADILEKIPGSISEMWVVVIVLRIPSHYIG